MAHKKAGGAAKNLRDSKPKYLGVKIQDGGKAKPGAIIVRQRGTSFLPGKNTKMGKDHTIFATSEGVVSFGKKRKKKYNGNIAKKKVVSVESK